MGNRPGWTKAWTFDAEAGIAEHESGARYRNAPEGPELEDGSDAKIQAIGASAASQVLKRLRKEAGDLFRKHAKGVAKAPPPAAPADDPGGATLRDLLRKDNTRIHPLESDADQHLIEHRFDPALEAYRRLPHHTALRIAEKIGWCLHHLDDHLAAIQVLGPFLPQLQTYALLALGYSLNPHTRGFATRKRENEELQDRLYAQILQMSVPIPASLLEMTWKFASHQQREQAVLLALDQHPLWAPALLYAFGWRRLLKIEPARMISRMRDALAAPAPYEFVAHLNWALAALLFESGDPTAALEPLTRVYELAQQDESVEAGDRAALVLALAVVEAVSDVPPFERKWELAYLGSVSQLPESLAPVSWCLDVWRSLENEDAAGITERLDQLIRYHEQKGPYFPETLFSSGPNDLHLPHAHGVQYAFRVDFRSHIDALLKFSTPAQAAYLRVYAPPPDTEPDEPSLEDRRRRAHLVLECLKLSDAPLILREAASAWATIEQPDWAQAGRCWGRFLAWTDDDWACESVSPLQIHGVDPTPEQVELCNHEVLAALDATPGVYAQHHSHILDWAERVGEALQDKSVSPSLTSLAERLLPFERNPKIVFWAALGHHNANRFVDAAALYDELLTEDSTHYGAIHNRLLILAQHPDVARLKTLEPLINHESFGKTQQRTLRDLFNRASGALVDPRHTDAAKGLLRAAAAQWPSADQTPDLNSQTFLNWLTLRSIVSASGSDPNTLRLNPFGHYERPLAPTREFNGTLFSLLRTGLLHIDTDRSKAGSVGKNAEGNFTYALGDLFWSIHPATLEWMNRIEMEMQQDQWPAGWRAELQGIAIRLARAEVIQYMRSLADERSWPWPEDEEKLESLARNLVDHVSVSQAYYFCYLGARTAADYRAKYRAALPSTSTRMLNATIQKFEHWLEARYPPKGYDRTSMAPRSWLSKTLYERVLNWDEQGFTTRIAELPFPVEEPAKPKKPRPNKKLH